MGTCVPVCPCWGTPVQVVSGMGGVCVCEQEKRTRKGNAFYPTAHCKSLTPKKLTFLYVWHQKGVKNDWITQIINTVICFSKIPIKTLNISSFGGEIHSFQGDLGRVTILLLYPKQVGEGKPQRGSPAGPLQLSQVATHILPLKEMANAQFTNETARPLN